MTLALFILMNVVGPAFLGYAGYPSITMFTLALTIAVYKVARGWRMDERSGVGRSIVRGYVFSTVLAAPIYFLARWVSGAAA